MHKEPMLDSEVGVAGIMTQAKPVNAESFKKNTSKFYYWIEFLHHRKTGQKIWLKRRREEILISARYAKEQVRNYE